MTRAAIEAYFNRYAEAFSRGDVDAVAELWSFPAVISTPAGEHVFGDEDGFRQNTEALCSFYARRGLARAEMTVAKVAQLAADVASVTTGDRLYDANGKLIAAWRHAYVVREHEDGIRAFMAVADNEIAEWSARGAPLGSN